MKGNTKISAIAIAAALGTLMATSHGASARSFSPAMPGSNVQVDWGVLDQLGNSETDTSGSSFSGHNTNPRIKIDSQLLIYPQTSPKSRFLAPQLLLTPPGGAQRFDAASTRNTPGNTIDDLETVVIDGAGVIPSDTSAQNPQAPVILRPPVERVQLRAPASFPSRPAVEEFPPATVPSSGRTTGNLGGPLAADMEDDGAPQIIHLVQPAPHQPPARTLDGLPRAKPAENAARRVVVSANATPATAMTVSAPAHVATPASAPAAKPASLLTPAPAAPVAKIVQVADKNTATTKATPPTAPKITEPHIDTPREAPKNKMAVPPVNTVPLPDKNAIKPAPKPKDIPSVTPNPLEKDNAVPTAPAPAPGTTTSPQKMTEPQARVMPKPPAPKPAIHKAAPLPEPRPAPQPQKQQRETASAPASLAMDKPKAEVTAGGDYSLPFSENSFELDNGARKRLDAIVRTLTKDDDLRVQLQAYAAGESQNASKARRLSLSRALQVRSYLIDSGVRSTRIDVRALGANVPSGPADRVDVKTVQR